MRGLVGTTMPSNLVLYNDANPVMGENPLISTTDFSPSSHPGPQEMKDASVCSLLYMQRIENVVVTSQNFVLRQFLLDIISPCVKELEYLMLRCAESWLAPHRI